MCDGWDGKRQPENAKQDANDYFLHKLSMEKASCGILQQELPAMKNLPDSPWAFERRDDGIHALTEAMQNCWLARLGLLDVSVRSKP
jgi:hypothetical protein